MKSVRVALSAFGGAFLLASSAMAADIAAIPPPIWGIYFGGGGCYDWATLDGEFGQSPYTTPAKGDAEAPCLTVTAGVDRQLDSTIVIGAFVSYDWQDKEGDVYTNVPQTAPTLLGQFAVGNILTVAGRAGILINPELLFYGLVGWSWSEFTGTAGATTISKSINGPTVGLGIESLFHPNWSGRLEGRVTSFGTFTHPGPPAPATASITDTSIRVVLTYRP
jgi:outer membrane immunogenic protein